MEAVQSWEEVFKWFLHSAFPAKSTFLEKRSKVLKGWGQREGFGFPMKMDLKPGLKSGKREAEQAHGRSH